MREYQLKGLAWLVQRHSNAVGGILGDEMGLGKTLQVCSFLTHLKTDLKVEGPYLVVCPLSVLETWVNELRRWCPSLRTVRYHGNERERQRMRSQDLRSGFFDVIVTSYETLIADPSLFRHSRFVWRYVVLDEAQRIKNEQTLLGKAVRYLRTSGKLLLTGTPLQNNLRELWALLNFLFPDVLKDATGFEVESNDMNAIKAAQALLEPLMLRRTKKSIGINIPPKTEVRVLAPLSPVQRMWYKKVLEKDAGLLSLLGQNSGGSAESFTKLANMLMQLRKVSSHPWLLPGVEPPPTAGRTDGRIITDSGKMVILDKLLTRIHAEGRKTVVFSQFTMVLDIIHDYLEYRGFGFFRLDGSTSAAKRRYVPFSRML
jgi:SWI/SNF-related matrix-associated actin-dependent regulator of chromatin subfamily A member 5